MSISTALLVAIASGVFALLGALGSQAIAALANLRAKRMELSYGHKADAYRDFMIKAGTFAHDPWNEEKYVQFLHAYLAVQIVSSEDVRQILTGDEGVNHCAQRMRVERDLLSMGRISSGPWTKSMESLTIAMRDDLQKLSKN